MKIAFITNICAHYRIRTFELLSNELDIDYYFFSAGEEWYWQKEHGVSSGKFNFEYLPGIQLGRTRVTPTLPWKLFRDNHDLYIKCINGRFNLPATYLIARLKRKPFILWTGIWTRLQTPIHRIFFPITRLIYHNADAIVVYGNHTKQYLISEGVPDERVFIANHAVDNSTFQRTISEAEKATLRHQLNIEEDNKVVLFIGRLEPVKGLPYLLDAFASIHSDDAILVIGGSGSEQTELEQMSQDLGISNRVRFAGYIPHHQTPVYYSLAWVVTLPSVTMQSGKELWGLVVNEAFNKEVPVIVSNAVGAASGGLVIDGENGFIVPERDSESLAKALNKILIDKDLRNLMGKNARKVISNWDNKNMVKGFLDAIDYVTTK